MAINKMESEEAWSSNKVLANLLVDHAEFTEARGYLLSLDYVPSVVIDLLLDNIHKIESEIVETLNEIFNWEGVQSSS